jgi:hypothetical protein
VKGLDAGAAITVTTPSAGTLQLPRNVSQNLITYSKASSGQPGQPGYVASFVSSSGGMFTFDNGTGGPDVEHFNTSLSVAPAVVWTNIDTVGPDISSSAPPTLSWTGGDPNGFIQIIGTSGQQTGPTSMRVTSFTCTALQSALKFTIPRWVLLAMLPTGNVNGVPFGSLTVNSHGPSEKFNAPGIDAAYQFSYTGSGKAVNYAN